MDRYTLDDKLRRTRRRFKLTATEQALYHELVMVCNEEGWAETFSCSNGELCSALGISSEKTLCAARESLINAGLIYYQSGKSKRQFSLYSFERPFDKNINYGKNYAQYDNQSASQSVSQSASQSGQNGTDYNNKQKLKYNTSPIVPQGDQTLPFKEEKPKRQPKTKKEFVPPTQEEVLSFFSGSLLPDWETQGRLFFANYQSQGWRKGTGVPVTEWDSLANKWILNEKIKRDGRNTTGPGTNSKAGNDYDDE